MRFEFPTNLIGKLTIFSIFNSPIKACTQILVHTHDQVGAQNKDFDVALQINLTRS